MSGAQLTINGHQADALVDVMRDHIDGEEVTFTGQGDGTLVVAFSLATYTIDSTGVLDES
jgi:hypothetical protein